MAPAPKRKVEEPSSEYCSETPPPAEAGQERRNGQRRGPPSPRLTQPKEAKEAKAKEPEPKQWLAEPEVKKKPRT